MHGAQLMCCQVHACFLDSLVIVALEVRASMRVQWRECCRVGVSAGVDQGGMLQLLQSMFLGPTVTQLYTFS